MNYYASVCLRKILIIGLLLTYADCHARQWHPAMGIESGIGIVTNAGQSQTFYAETENDQFYIYTANDALKIPALYGGFLGVEWSGDSDWSFELQADYNQSSAFSVDGTVTQGLDVQSQDIYNYQYSMRMRQLLGNVKVRYARSKIISPYFLACLGASFNTAENYETTAPLNVAITKNYADYTSSSCSYALGIGFDIAIIDQVRIGIGYRFANLGKVSLGSATINTVFASGTLSQSSLYVNEFLAQLSFVF